MNRHRDQNNEMGIQNFFAWRTQPAANEPAVTDDEIPAEVDEPPDRRAPQEQQLSGFHKSAVRLQGEPKESLLTKAFQKHPETDASRPEIQVNTDLTRRRSMMSNASLASTAELTSDGGLTSPARTNTPSPPFPNTTYTSFAPYSLATRTAHPPPTKVAVVGPEHVTDVVSISPKSQPVADPPRKRLIQFACDGKKGTKPEKKVAVVPAPLPPVVNTEAPKRRCTFACALPKPSDKSVKPKANLEPKSSETQRAAVPDSPTTLKKSPRTSIPLRPHRDSTSTVRHVSPVVARAKPKYIIADEETLQASE